MYIGLWSYCIVIIATCRNKSRFLGSRLIYIAVQWISIKKVEIFDRGSHPKPLSFLIKPGMYIGLWSYCIVIIATCRNKSRFLGSRLIYIAVQWISIKKVEIFEVWGPGSHPKPLSILIKLGKCIPIWLSCLCIIATCWHKSWFLGYKQKYIDV